MTPADLDAIVEMLDDGGTVCQCGADIARWECLRGRAAIFASFGLGKTRMQLEIARQTVAHATIETDAAEVLALLEDVTAEMEAMSHG